jgi:hypothetical protein
MESDEEMEDEEMRVEKEEERSSDEEFDEEVIMLKLDILMLNEDPYFDSISLDMLLRMAIQSLYGEIDGNFSYNIVKYHNLLAEIQIQKK